MYAEIKLNVDLEAVLSNALPRADGIASAGTGEKAAREDHVHPFVIPTAPIVDPPIGFAYIDLVEWTANGNVVLKVNLPDRG
jgi:hypothetical protein